MTQLLLIRHGLNDYVGRKLAGRLPGVHLNEAGRRQAQTLVEILQQAPIKAIYSSPLERAVETAEPLANALGLTIQIRSDLQEIDFGRWVGKSPKQMSRTNLWKLVQESPSQVRFPDGESYIEAQTRIVSIIKSIAAAHEDNETIACFSHADAIRLAIAYFLGMPLDAFQRLPLETTSITALMLPKEGQPRFWLINQRPSVDFKPPEKKMHPKQYQENPK